MFPLHNITAPHPAISRNFTKIAAATFELFGGAPETYAYDTASNQLDSVTAGGATRLLTYSASGNTEFDDRGADPNWDFIYDSTDRLIRVEEEATVIASYTHNAMGQRVSKTVGAATTHFLYGPGGLIGEADGGTGAVQAEYVWLGGMPLAYIQGGAVYYIHPDHLGTPQRITGAGGALAWDASYTPFGEAEVSGTLTFNLRFPGQYHDAETGLHYNGFRDYDPTTGRYIQSDPIGLRGGWNIYWYVANNPVLGVDRKGLDVEIIGTIFNIDATIIDFNYVGVFSEDELRRVRDSFYKNRAAFRLPTTYWDLYKISAAANVTLECEKYCDGDLINRWFLDVQLDNIQFAVPKGVKVKTRLPGWWQLIPLAVDAAEQAAVLYDLTKVKDEYVEQIIGHFMNSPSYVCRQDVYPRM